MATLLRKQLNGCSNALYVTFQPFSRRYLLLFLINLFTNNMLLFFIISSNLVIIYIVINAMAGSTQNLSEQVGQGYFDT